MPLNTQIRRNGEPLSLAWGGFHVAAMVYAVVIDSGIGPFEDNSKVAAEAERLMAEQGEIGVTPADAFGLVAYHVLAATPLNSDDYTMVNVDLKFVDVTDGEVLEIRRGDVLSAGRSL